MKWLKDWWIFILVLLVIVYVMSADRNDGDEQIFIDTCTDYIYDWASFEPDAGEISNFCSGMYDSFRSNLELYDDYARDRDPLYP